MSSPKSTSPLPFLTGFCGYGTFHERCPGVVAGIDCTCTCHHPQPPFLLLLSGDAEVADLGDTGTTEVGDSPTHVEWDLGDALTRLTDDVRVLSQAITTLPEDLSLVERCDLLGQVREQRQHLAEIESLLERDAARAFPYGQSLVEWEGGTAERRGGKDRKEWDHDGVTRAVTAAIIPGLAVDPNGEVDTDLAALLHKAVELYAATNRPSWRTTALRPLGVDPDEYCTAVPGRASVQVNLAERTS